MAERFGAHRNKVIGLMIGSILSKKWRLTSYISVGTSLYLSSIGLMATSVYLISKAALRPAILTLGVLMAGTRYFALSKSASRYLERVVSHSAVLGGLTHLRIAVFRALAPMFPQETTRFSSGEIIGKVSSSMDDVQNLLLRLLGPLVLLVATALSLLLFGLIVQPQAGIVLFSVLAVFAISGATALAGFGMAAAHKHYLARVSFEKEGEEVLRSSEELFLAGRLGSRLHRLGELSEQLETCDTRRLKRAANYNGLALFAAQAVFVAVCYLSVTAAERGEISVLLVAVMPVVALAAFEIVQPVVQGSTLAPWYLQSIEELPVEGSESDVKDCMPTGKAIEISFSGVILKRGPVAEIGPLNFRIPSGSKCAIVGESGSGKTSVAYAMLGCISPCAGQVSLVAPGLRHPSPVDEIGFLPERPAVLESSLRSNLALANLNAQESQLVEALGKVSLDYLLDRPEGLDQLLGGFGVQLSGGECQRLGLARLLLGGFGTVILDEPTASLDEKTSRQVVEAVFNAFGGKTVVMITHDRSLEAYFDQVIEIS